ncbi:MAG TPA: T9SS type A sorting domain-containing protein [Candidatus Krumholzibacteriaceae bacterium]|nr:T9SS type A sorting domain-containing protein [Candidatus Krumholzibacteriaceae bacterium]
MKSSILLLLIPLLLLFPARTSAQYMIPHGTFNSGGTVRSGTNIIYDTAGQAAADKLTGSSHSVKLGFWYIADLESAVDVAIVSFKGEYTNDKVLLSWTVKSDAPFDGYCIYRAEGDDVNFTRINESVIDAETTVEYSDPGAIPGRSYRYYISAVKEKSEVVRSPTFELTLPPKPITLYQNFPNPFNPSTTIRFFIPDKRRVTLDIFDVRGRKINTLIDEIKTADRYRAEWDGRNSRGKPVSSGVYYYRLSAGKKVITKKLVLMR